MSETEAPTVTKAISVGFLLEDQPDCLMLVSSVGDLDDEDDDPQAVGGIVIAKRQITKITELRKGGVIFSCGELAAMLKRLRFSAQRSISYSSKRPKPRTRRA